MNQQERRQAHRIIRNAREAESYFFELIEELQEASHENAADYDWLCALDKLQSIQERLPVLVDLVRNIDQAVRQT